MAQKSMKHAIGTREQWLKARLKLLEEEKALTRRSDELARKRQALPWVRVDKDYEFATENRNGAFQARRDLARRHVRSRLEHVSARDVRHELVRKGRRARLPRLLNLRARARRSLGNVSVAGPCSQGAQRGRRTLVAPSRRVRKALSGRADQNVPYLRGNFNRRRGVSHRTHFLGSFSAPQTPSPNLRR